LPNLSIEQAMSNTNLTEEQINKVTLDVEGGKLIYFVSEKRLMNLFWIIPVNMEVTQKISAENGHLISTEKPWWSFLASEK